MHYHMVIRHILGNFAIFDPLDDYIVTRIPARQLLDQHLYIRRTFLLV